MHVFADFVFGQLSKGITAKPTGTKDTIFFDLATFPHNHTIPHIHDGEVFYLMVEERPPTALAIPRKELMKVTGVSLNDRHMSVERAVDGATGIAIADDDVDKYDVFVMVVAQDLDNFIQKDDLAAFSKLATSGFRISTTNTEVIDGVTYVPIKLNFSAGVENKLYLPLSSDALPMYLASGVLYKLMEHHPYNDGVVSGSMFMFNVSNNVDSIKYSASYIDLIEQGYALCDGRVRYNPYTGKSVKTPDLLGVTVPCANAKKAPDAPTYSSSPRKFDPPVNDIRRVKTADVYTDKFEYTIAVPTHDHGGKSVVDVVGYSYRTVSLVAATGTSAYSTIPSHPVYGFAEDGGVGKLSLMETDVKDMPEAYKQSVYWNGGTATTPTHYIVKSPTMVGKVAGVDFPDYQRNRYYGNGVTFKPGEFDWGSNLSVATVPAISSVIRLTSSSKARAAAGNPVFTSIGRVGGGSVWFYMELGHPTHNYGGERIGVYSIWRTLGGYEMRVTWGQGKYSDVYMRKNPRKDYSKFPDDGWAWYGPHYPYGAPSVAQLNSGYLSCVASTDVANDHIKNSAANVRHATVDVNVSSTSTKTTSATNYEHRHIADNTIKYESLCWFMKV